MTTKLLSALALLPVLFTVACDDPDLDPQTAEMIEICEALEGDCDEEIEAYLAEVEADEADVQNAAEDAVPFDPPDGLTTLPACTHCNDGPREQLHTPTAPAQPASDDAELDLDFAAGPDDEVPCPPFEYDELRNPS